jgi:hypothetical protein
LAHRNHAGVLLLYNNFSAAYPCWLPKSHSSCQ